jgi:hypothetical protein
MQVLQYEEDNYSARRRKWNFIATCYLFGGALCGILFVGLFVRGPHWLTNLIGIGFGYGGGAFGAFLYKRFHCTPLTR